MTSKTNKNPPKLLAKLGLYGTFFDLMRGIYTKSKPNIILNGEILKAFPLKWGLQEYPLFLLVFNTKLEKVPISIMTKLGNPTRRISFGMLLDRV